MSAKEKIISELNLELHNIETTLSNEREEHLNEIKKLNVLLNEKVCHVVFLLLIQCLELIMFWNNGSYCSPLPFIGNSIPKT